MYFRHIIFVIIHKIILISETALDFSLGPIVVLCGSFTGTETILQFFVDLSSAEKWPAAHQTLA